MKTQSLLLLSTILLSSCVASFEESTGRIALPTAPRATSNRCHEISARARWESALAKGGAALTAASGLSTIPVESRNGRLGIAIGTVAAAAGTVLVLALWESDASEYLAEGCGTLTKGTQKP